MFSVLFHFICISIVFLPYSSFGSYWFTYVFLRFSFISVTFNFRKPLAPVKPPPVRFHIAPVSGLRPKKKDCEIPVRMVAELAQKTLWRPNSCRFKVEKPKTENWKPETGQEPEPVPNQMQQNRDKPNRTVSFMNPVSDTNCHRIPSLNSLSLSWWKRWRRPCHHRGG